MPTKNKIIKISCPTGCDSVSYDIEKFSLKPGLDFGIDKTRFLVLPNIFCIQCNSLCHIELIEETTITKTETIRGVIKLI